MLKKFPSGKINSSKNALVFLFRAPTYYSFTFNLQFSYELKHKIRLSNTGCCTFHFRFSFVFVKVYIIFSTKCMDVLTLKHHNSFQNQTNRNTTYNFPPRTLIFILQKEVLKFNDIYMC